MRMEAKLPLSPSIYTPEKLDLDFFCELECSSTIDDDTIIDLARAMSELETLRYGDRLCQTPVGVTTKGLAALAHCCVRLYELRIHFQVASLDPPEVPNFAYIDERSFPLGDCALTDLDVGNSDIPEASVLMVALTLLRIFPRLNWIEHGGEGWEKVANAIGLSSDLADYSSKKIIFAAPRCAVDDPSPGSSIRR